VFITKMLQKERSILRNNKLFKHVLE